MHHDISLCHSQRLAATSVTGFSFGLLAHRMLHKFRLDECDLKGDEKP